MDLTANHARMHYMEKRQRLLFEKRDALSGDSLKVESDGNRVILTTEVSGRPRRVFVLVNRDDGLRLAERIHEALTHEPRGGVRVPRTVRL